MYIQVEMKYSTKIISKQKKSDSFDSNVQLKYVQVKDSSCIFTNQNICIFNPYFLSDFKNMKFL